MDRLICFPHAGGSAHHCFRIKRKNRKKQVQIPANFI